MSNDDNKLDNIKINIDLFNSNMNQVIRICSPLATNLTQLRYNTNETINVSNKHKIALQLTYDDINFPENITPFDKAVLNAVCTICWYGETSFTAAQLYQIVSGGNKKIGLMKNENEPKEIIKNILNSMTKLRKTWVQSTKKLNKNEEVNWSAILSASKTAFTPIGRADKTNDNKIENGYNLLNFETGKVTLYGQEVLAYELLKEPRYLTEALDNKQIYAIDREVNNMPCSATWRTITVRDHLIGRIEALKNENNKMYQTNILCTSIYDAIIQCSSEDYFGEEKTGNLKGVLRKQIRDIAVKILKNWVKIGYIAGFCEYKNGKTIEGYKILLNDEDQLSIDKKLRKLVKAKKGR